MPTNDYSYTSPETFPASTNKGEAVYNADWGHDGNLRRHLTGASNQNLCV